MSNQYPLKYAPHFSSVIHRLSLLPRTGWVMRGIENGESVWEHTLAMRDVAIKYRSYLHISDNDFRDLLAIIEVHDWPEAIVGDQVILGDEPDADELRMKKSAEETAAMNELCAHHAYGDDVMNFYIRYRDVVDHVASLAKQLDKFQAIQKAYEYEQKHQKKGLADEFVFYIGDYIKHPILIQKLNELRAGNNLID